MDFEGNKITNFKAQYFVNYTDLRGLYLGNNLITKFPVNLSTFFPSISKLSVIQNKISTIDQADFEGYHSLSELDISENQIEKLDANVFQNIPLLTILDVKQNRIKTLKNGTLNGLSRLDSANFDGNDIDSIESGVFINLPDRPFQLDLSNNKIHTLTPGMFSTPKGDMKLSLKANALTSNSIHPGAFNVGELHLDSNNLTTIRKEWFKSSPSKLSLTNNPLICDCAFYQSITHLVYAGSGSMAVRGTW